MGLHPEKYYRGLSAKKKTQRRREIKKFGALGWKDPAAYVGFKTDRGVKTRKSHYTADWYKLFPEAKSLEAKSRQPVFRSDTSKPPTIEEWPRGEQDTDPVPRNSNGAMPAFILSF